MSEYVPESDINQITVIVILTYVTLPVTCIVWNLYRSDTICYPLFVHAIQEKYNWFGFVSHECDTNPNH